MAVILLLGIGTVVVMLILGLFTARERYRRPLQPERGVGFVEVRLAAGRWLSFLAPRVMLIAEKERTVDVFLAGSAPYCETRRTVEALRREVSEIKLWRRFVSASALIEEDPARACEELRLLAPIVEAALEKLGEAEKAIEGMGGEDGGRT